MKLAMCASCCLLPSLPLLVHANSGIPNIKCPGTGKFAAMATSRQQDGDEAAVQRASSLFLQQVEDSRRRYAFEVEELKVRLTLQGNAEYHFSKNKACM